LLPFTSLPSFDQYIKKLREKPLKNLYQQALQGILTDPYIGDQKVGDLQGYWGWDIMYKAINYEISYVIIEDEEGKPTAIVFCSAGTRENFWDDFKKYMKKRL